MSDDCKMVIEYLNCNYELFRKEKNEHFAFCSDSVFQGSGTVRSLASSLINSTT